MIKYEIRKVNTHVPISKECDVCHELYSDCTVMDKQEWKKGEQWEYQEFYHIDFYGGFGSVFGDESHVQCDICQNCLKDMIGKYCRINEDT
jgi:antirestriction protein